MTELAVKPARGPERRRSRHRPEGGTRQREVPERLAPTLCLDDAQLEALHTLALRCDEVFDGSHDLEWAFAGDRLYLLQRRTLKAIPTYLHRRPHH